jgi:hypothetical protein
LRKRPGKSVNEQKGDKKMKTNKFALVLGVVLTAILFAEVAAHADELDQSTKLTFSQPIQIPGEVLPAGTYLFKLGDTNTDYNLVQIFNSDGTRLYAALETIPTERPQTTDNTVVTLAEPGDGMPDVLLNWFYPGNTDGHAFVYSKHEEQELAEYPQQTVVAKDIAKNTAESGD